MKTLFIFTIFLSFSCNAIDTEKPTNTINAENTPEKSANKIEIVLNNLNVKPEIINLDRITSLKNNKLTKDILIKHSDNSNFPKIYFGTNCVGGYSDLYDLFTQNKLFEFLKKENIFYLIQ